MDEISNFDDFLEELAKHESRGLGNYNADNGKYIGRYQIGPIALIEAGYKNADGTWTGKNSIYSEQNFKDNHGAQEDAIRTYHEKAWGYIQNLGLAKYEGKIINGVPITKYGLIAGWHLKGGELKTYLESNGAIDPVDGFGTPVSKYVKEMAGDGFIRAPIPTEKPTAPLTGSAGTGALGGGSGADMLGAEGGGFFSSIGNFFSGIGNGISDFFGGLLGNVLGMGGGSLMPPFSPTSSMRRASTIDIREFNIPTLNTLSTSLLDKLTRGTVRLERKPGFDFAQMGFSGFSKLARQARTQDLETAIANVMYGKGDGIGIASDISNQVIGGLLRSGLGELFGGKHVSVSTRESARSRQVQHAFQFSRGQQAAELLRQLQKAKRDL